MSKDEEMERTTELVEEAFTVKNYEGLGNVLVCKLCGTIFVGLNDAKKHLTLYHRVLTRKRLEEMLYKVVKGKGETKPKERVHKVIDEYLTTKN